MSATGLPVFDQTVYKSNAWVNEIAESLGCDRHGAYHALRAVLHCLRDRLTVDEAAQLGDQFPTLVRGIYFEAWRPAGKPEKICSGDEFLERLSGLLEDAPIASANAARAVFQAMVNHVAAGEIEDLLEQLPCDVRKVLLAAA